MQRRSFCIALGSLAALPAWAAGGKGFVDPLDLPARTEKQPVQRPLRAAARAGTRLVAVGERGLIVLSDDNGQSWRQAAVPVSADLNAISFANDQQGWVVGHDSVILHTPDGGNTWQVQFDGRSLEALVRSHYASESGAAVPANAEAEADTEADADAEAAPTLLEEIEAMVQPGLASFLLDVACEDAQRVVAVGRFGLILGTEDGGKTWLPKLEQLPNPDYLHLSGVRRIAGQTWIAGERGHVWRRGAGEQSFSTVPVPYEGSLFGIVGHERFVIAYGMRGRVFRTADGGASWQSITTDVAAGLSDGAVFPDGQRVVLATQDGQLLVSSDAGIGFHRTLAAVPTMLASVVALPADQLLLAGLNGVHVQAMPG